MRKGKAINILTEQSDKLKNIDLSDTRNWAAETKNYLSYFFGKESHQYIHFKNNLTDSRVAFKKDKVISFLNDCCNIISNIGLYKPPTENWFSKLPDWSIIPIITSLIFIGSVLGRYQKDIAFIRMEKRIETLKDSIIIISTNKISYKVKKHTDKPKIE